MADLGLPPWFESSVGADSQLLIGPSLRLFEFDNAISPAEAVDVIHSDFDFGSLRDISPDLNFTATIKQRRAVVSASVNPIALALVDALNTRSHHEWHLVTTPPEDIVYIDIDNARPLSQVGQLEIDHRETYEGLAVGPIPSDGHRCFAEGTAVQESLELAGFKRHPSTLRYWVEHDVIRVANWIAILERIGACQVALPQPGRIVTHICALKKDLPACDDIDSLVWDFGPICQIEVAESIACPGVFLGSAYADVHGIPELSTHHGKGLDAKTARITTIGECIERISAAYSKVATRPASSEMTYSLRDFHPFGQEWDCHGVSTITTEMTTARCLYSGRIVSVPQPLVGFPYVGSAEAGRVTKTDTCGLATYPTRDGAVLRATLEVLERDDFYPNFLNLAVGWKLSADAEIDRLVLASGIQLRLVTFQGSHHPPFFVHAFAENPAFGPLLARGSGSGGTRSAAARAAFLESVQLLELGTEILNSQYAGSFQIWSQPSVKSAVVSYLDSFPALEASLPCGPPPTDEELLTSLVSSLHEQGRELLICDLATPVRGWHTVRALIPGATCSQHASSSRGGEKIANRRFQHPVPV